MARKFLFGICSTKKISVVPEKKDGKAGVDIHLRAGYK